jgi:hypothetical protein
MRAQELPFVVYNLPDITAASRDWTDDRLAALFGEQNLSTTVARRARAGAPGSFMYFDMKASTASWAAKHGYTAPTEQIPLNYTEWVRRSLAESAPDAADGAAYYYAWASISNSWAAPAVPPPPLGLGAP